MSRPVRLPRSVPITKGGFFDGDLSHLAATHPFRVSGRYPKETGHSLGIDQHGTVRRFDHALSRANKTISVPFALVLGEIGTGKTTLATKVMSDAFPNKFRGGKRARINVDITKRSGRISEYHQWINFVGSNSIDLASTYSDGINILDRDSGMSIDELAVIAKTFAEHEDTPLQARHKRLLRVGMSKLYHERGLIHLRTLNDFFASATLSDVERELRRLHVVNDATTLHMSAQEIHDTGQDLIDRFTTIMTANNGFFAGEGSIVRNMMQDVVSFDHTGLEPDTMPLVQAYLWRFKSSALRRDDDRFVFDVEVHDENYEMWQYPVYAKAMHSHIKKLRGRGSLLMLLSHRTRDYSSIGGDQGKLAVNMLNDVAIACLGRHTPDQLPDLKERFGLSNKWLQTLLILKPGQFVVKIGNEQPFLLNVWLTETMRRLTDTDTATRQTLEDEVDDEVKELIEC